MCREIGKVTVISVNLPSMWKCISFRVQATLLRIFKTLSGSKGLCFENKSEKSTATFIFLGYSNDGKRFHVSGGQVYGENVPLESQCI